MDVLYPNCAGLDVHKDMVVASRRRMGANRLLRTKASFVRFPPIMAPLASPAAAKE